MDNFVTIKNVYFAKFGKKIDDRIWIYLHLRTDFFENEIQTISCNYVPNVNICTDI